MLVFICDCCKYSSDDKSNFNKHLLSKKHKLLEIKMVKSVEVSQEKCKYCEEYKHSKIEELTELVRVLSLQVEQQQTQIDFIKSEIF